MRVLISGGGVAGLTCACWVSGSIPRPERVARLAPRLRCGFGDTSSILPIPPNDTKETEQ